MMGRALILAALAFAPAAAAAQGGDAVLAAPQHLGALRTPTPLPGWDEAAASAGCLAVASNLPPYLPEAATPQQVRDEGAFWSWRLKSLAPDEPVQIEYWEAAHGWLEEELKSMEIAEAREFLADYRGRCVIAQAAVQSDMMWGALQ